ncbi:MAG: hypothetical protein IJU00_09540 [Selenomonas sp.]|nr:hypothetical protein [Selenomonas sp.]
MEPIEVKEDIRRRARMRHVVIYGGDNLAYQFICEYEGVLDIRMILVDDMDDVHPALRQTYEVALFSETEICKNDYVIVCKPFIHNLDVLPPYAVARNELLKRGYVICEDFIYYRVFDAIEKGKPIMMFCGYCELGGLKQVLELTKANDEYCMLFYHIGRDTMRQYPGYDGFLAASRLCDILIHAPILVDRGIMDVDILKMVSPAAQKIFIPQVSFRGYAPYKSSNFRRRNSVIRLFEKERYPFLYEIKNVNSMLRKGMSNEKILAELKRPDLFTEEEIRKNLEEAFRILEIMDAKGDIHIADFVKKNYKKTLMYKDCIHANDLIFFEYARRLSRFLGKDWEEEINLVEERCRQTGAFFQVASEEPILPCVAKALGLEFATEDYLYMEKVTDEKIRMRTFDEWFEDYCDYYRAVQKINLLRSLVYKTQRVRIYRNEGSGYRLGENVRNGYS